jgi:hypothetical protein
MLLLAAVGLALASSVAAAAPANPLALLVVPRQELGPVARGLWVELSSGATSNARAAQDSYDPADSGASLAAAGRIAGYSLFYGDPGLEALRTGHGLVEVGTSVDEFRTSKQAGAFDDKSLRDLQQARGRNLGGTVVERISTFATPGLGTAARGVRVVERLGRRHVYSTLIDFRLGLVVGEAVVRRTDATRADSQTIAIARRLADRILQDARGTLRATPVTLPRQLGTARPGPKAPKLDRMALTSTSFGKAAGLVTGQGYVPDDTAIASFFRELRFDPRTGLVLARSTVELERSKREAAGRMLLQRESFEGRGAAGLLARSISGSATSPVLDAPPHRIGAGDDSFAVSATFGAQGQRLRAVLMQVTAGRVVGTLVVVGTAKSLTPSRATGYGRAQAERMRRAVSALIA